MENRISEHEKKLYREEVISYGVPLVTLFAATIGLLICLVIEKEIFECLLVLLLACALIFCLVMALRGASRRKKKVELRQYEAFEGEVVSKEDGQVLVVKKMSCDPIKIKLDEDTYKQIYKGWKGIVVRITDEKKGVRFISEESYEGIDLPAENSVSSAYRRKLVLRLTGFLILNLVLDVSVYVFSSGAFPLPLVFLAAVVLFSLMSVAASRVLYRNYTEKKGELLFVWLLWIALVISCCFARTPWLFFAAVIINMIFTLLLYGKDILVAWKIVRGEYLCAPVKVVSREMISYGGYKHQTFIWSLAVSQGSGCCHKVFIGRRLFREVSEGDTGVLLKVDVPFGKPHLEFAIKDK